MAKRSPASRSKRASTQPAAAKADPVPKTPARPDAPADPALKRRAATIYQRLHKLYPDARCALDHQNPYQLLVATILSAQCTDKRVNMVTPALFRAYPDPQALAGSEPAALEKLIQSTGFYRNKARNLKEAARKIVQDHHGRVPRTMEELTALPGVARKTANVVLGNAFDTHVGVVVDTHVARLARRLGLTTHTDPAKIERDLMALFPRKRWTLLAHLLITHGRNTCTARNPDCEHCILNSLCPKFGVTTKQSTPAAKAGNAGKTTAG